jgi:hypothetical protein
MFPIDFGGIVSTVIRAPGPVIYDRYYGFPRDLGTPVGAWRSK